MFTLWLGFNTGMVISSARSHNFGWALYYMFFLSFWGVAMICHKIRDTIESLDDAASCRKTASYFRYHEIYLDD